MGMKSRFDKLFDEMLDDLFREFRGPRNKDSWKKKYDELYLMWEEQRRTIKNYQESAHHNYFLQQEEMEKLRAEIRVLKSSLSMLRS